VVSTITQRRNRKTCSFVNRNEEISWIKTTNPKVTRSRLAKEYIYYSKEIRTINNRGLYVWDAKTSNANGTKERTEDLWKFQRINGY
jgi:hypothetical protein